MQESLRKSIRKILKTDVSRERLEYLEERLLDLCEQHIDTERQDAWDDGYADGLTEGEINANGDWQDGYDEGYEKGLEESEDLI